MWCGCGVFVLQVSLRSSHRLRLMVSVTSVSTACLLYVSPLLWVALKWGHRMQEPASLWTIQPTPMCFSATPSISDREETDLRWELPLQFYVDLKWELPVFKLTEKCFQTFLLVVLFLKHPYLINQLIICIYNINNLPQILKASY